MPAQMRSEVRTEVMEQSRLASPSAGSAASEQSALVKPTLADPDSFSSFVMATDLLHETKLVLERSALISCQMLSQLGTAVVVIMFVGQLADSSLYIAGVGFARTFVNVTGTAMSWGFTTALFTLIPQSIGAGHPEHAAIHIQRAFYVVSVVATLLSLIQFFAGDIMVAMGQPTELRDIVNTYCRLLIPYIYAVAYASILQRLLQALDMNTLLTLCASLMLATCPLLCYFFMFVLDCGYYGAAIAQNLSMLVFILAMTVLLHRKGYAHIFVPLPMHRVCTRKGITNYLALAVPGLFQNAFQWIIQEIAVILAGYVASPTVVLSTIVILSNLFLVADAFSIGIGNAVSIRVGKYIGRGRLRDAQHVGRIGAVLSFVLSVLFGVLLMAGRHALPRLYSDDWDIVALTTSLMPILFAYCAGNVVLATVGGIYRGMGLQRIAAVCTLTAYWIAAFPCALVLLFGFDFAADARWGAWTIWGSLAAGNFLSCAAEIAYLLIYADWSAAVQSSQQRVQHTIKQLKDYRSCSDSSTVPTVSVGVTTINK